MVISVFVLLPLDYFSSFARLKISHTGPCPPSQFIKCTKQAILASLPLGYSPFKPSFFWFAPLCKQMVWTADGWVGLLLSSHVQPDLSVIWADQGYPLLFEKIKNKSKNSWKLNTESKGLVKNTLTLLMKQCYILTNHISFHCPWEINALSAW